MTQSYAHLNEIIQGDCLEVMKDIPDKSVDIVVIDPPYNIGKDDRWDKWETVGAYVEFMSEVFTECERVLKDSGSFYWFHNDMAQIRKLMDAIDGRTDFEYKQFIVWNKRFEGVSNKGFLDGFIEVEHLRNYQKMAEYCLFYTLQDELEYVKGFDIIRDYLREEAISAFGHVNGMNTFLGFAEKGGMATRKYLGRTQFYIPTEEHYTRLQETGYFKKPYTELKKMYENARYTFINQRTHHSVWNYEVAPKVGHVTPKPVELIENIIRHSTNEGDIVLDCFLGSGTTAVAAINTDRQFIGIEQEAEYVEIARQRITDAKEALT